MSVFCLDFNPLRIVSLSIAVISTSVGVIMIICGHIKSVSIHKIKMLRPFILTYHVTCFFWVIGMIGYTLFESLLYTDLCNNFILINSLFGVGMGFIGYLFGLIGVYCLFLLRLKYSFISTILQISKGQYYILLTGVFIQIILTIITAYYFITLQWDVGVIFSYSTIIINTVYSIALLALFIRNIYKLQKQSKHKNGHNQSTKISTINNESSSYYSSKQSIDIEVIHSEHPFNNLAEETVKYTICAFFAFLSSILVNFMSFYRGFLSPNGDSMDLLNIHVSLNVFDCLITIICLHLQFSYLSSYYKKLCKVLRHLCKSYALKKFDESQNNADQTDKLIEIKSISEKTSTELPKLNAFNVSQRIDKSEWD